MINIINLKCSYIPSEFVTLLPAVYYDILPSRCCSGSDHVTVKHDQAKGVGYSVIWPRGEVKHGYMTICSGLKYTWYQVKYEMK